MPYYLVSYYPILTVPQNVLSTGHLPIPANFTTVGKPAIYVNQYDNPIDVYSGVSHYQHWTKQHTEWIVAFPGMSSHLATPSHTAHWEEFTRLFASVPIWRPQRSQDCSLTPEFEGKSSIFGCCHRQMRTKISWTIRPFPSKIRR